MAKLNGTVLKMYVSGSPDKKIQNVKDISFSISTKEIDVTDDDSGGWAEYLGGLRSWTAKATMNVDFVTAAGKEGTKELVTKSIARLLVDFEFTTLLTGDTAFSGSALITDISPSRSAEGAITATIDMLGSGPMVPAVIV
jgi:predicted secreted protein